MRESQTTCPSRPFLSFLSVPNAIWTSYDDYLTIISNQHVLFEKSRRLNHASTSDQ